MKLLNLSRGLPLVAALTLTACATAPAPAPFYATEVETVAARGEPVTRWDNGDGTTTLEYATQPDGTTCLMTQVDADGRVLRQWDALDDKNLARVKPGMSKGEVARLLGTHRSERVYPSTNEVVWDWNIAHRGRGVATRFNVHFTDERVRYVGRTRIYPPGREPTEYSDRFWYDDWEPWYPLYPLGAFWLWMNIGSGHWGGGHHGGWHGGYGGGGHRGGGGHGGGGGHHGGGGRH
jgi:uncharacterized membrane protein YgcG